jgi:hypothetical protein
VFRIAADIAPCIIFAIKRVHQLITGRIRRRKRLHFRQNLLTFRQWASGVDVDAVENDIIDEIRAGDCGSGRVNSVFGTEKFPARRNRADRIKNRRRHKTCAVPSRSFPSSFHAVAQSRAVSRTRRQNAAPDSSKLNRLAQLAVARVGFHVAARFRVEQNRFDG